jgi:formate dehydrogenase subunit gamma
MVFVMGHIYIGTIGTEGALDGMKTGYCDESWARQHHGIWLDDINSGKIPASREPENAPLSNIAKKIVRTTT